MSSKFIFIVNFISSFNISLGLFLGRSLRVHLCTHTHEYIHTGRKINIYTVCICIIYVTVYVYYMYTYKSSIWLHRLIYMWILFFQVKSCFIKRNKVHVHTETDKNVRRIFLHNNNKLMTHGGSEVKASACSAGDLGSIPGLGRSPGEGNGNPLQYSCLENPMDGGAWWATVHGVAKNRTRLRDFTFTSLSMTHTMT